MIENVYTIDRVGRPSDETAAKISYRDARNRLRECWVNPQTEILLATGRDFGRENCISGFALGLAMTGHTVVINDRRKDKKPTVRLMQPPTTPLVNNPYFSLGFFWGLGRWKR